MPDSPPPPSPVYPAGLAAAERKLTAERRQRAAVSSAPPLVGVALSGGGIRSATFCLGLFQSLARQGLIRRVDLLSTVSGGGYFGSFLGAAFSRDGSTVDRIEKELADNHSWSVNWLRENGRFLSPNGAGDNWHAAAVALRNWLALHLVLLTFFFFLLGLGALIRADLSLASPTAGTWLVIEQFFWNHQGRFIWWSPWLLLPLLPFAAVMIPTGSLYWLTQFPFLVGALRRLLALAVRPLRAMTVAEFASRAQSVLTRGFTVGLASTVTLLAFGVVDSLGQSAYYWWSARGFEFPALWTLLTGTGALAFGFGSRVALYLDRLLGSRRFRIPFNVVALILALSWLLLIVVALSVLACGLAWQWQLVWDGLAFQPMSGGWPLMLALAICFGASWIFSRSFGFVNLSSLQQTYAARLARAYLGATNPERQRHANHSMTELIPGDEVALDAYTPHEHGGPLHFVNVTVNETLSGKTQIERRDRKGLAMAVGPCGLSVGTASHALWADSRRGPAPTPLQALCEAQQRAIIPITGAPGEFHALCDPAPDSPQPQRIEALPLGRWVAISGAAFTTGTGASTDLGLSLLLGLANVRLGYWWDSGISAGHCGNQRPNFLEVASRLLSRILPVQTCLMNEFFARFHGPARRHWYLSDGGHFENTGCYELIRRRVPFIICSDAGQDPDYRFGDFANLVRKARTDFGAEIQIIRRAGDTWTDDPGVRFPLPKLDELVHPSLLDVIGVPEDFSPLTSPGASDGPRARPRARCHAILARIHYLDTNDFGWLLLIKPGLMGDEAADVIEYQHTHPLFPQEPTTDQYFDEAQWESYRKLGEHIGVELFTEPAVTDTQGPGWTPASMQAPTSRLGGGQASRGIEQTVAQAFAEHRARPPAFEATD